MKSATTFSLAAIFALGTAGMAMTGCEDDSALEDAGENIEDAAEDTGEAIEEGANDLGRELEDATD